MIYFRGIKGRGIKAGQRVKVYRNLNVKAKHLGSNNDLPVYSVMDAASRLVLGYTQCIRLYDVAFEVSEKGRQKVLDTGRKNVHAFVVGRYDHKSWSPEPPESFTVKYNPRVGPDFTTIAGTPLSTAGYVVINASGVHASLLLPKGN